MCGIAGIMFKRSDSRPSAPIGKEMVKMLESMKHRGMDSSGVTVAGQSFDGDFIIRIWANEIPKASGILSKAEQTVIQSGGDVQSKHVMGQYMRLTVNYKGEIPLLASALLNTDGVELHSIGKLSEIVKDVGTPMEMDGRHSISKLNGSHAIGHVRMATESRVDINHAHPFWAYPFPDLTVVHNGQLTNYHGLKRKYEDLGHYFQTDNDSELIAVYLAEKLTHGSTLHEALKSSTSDLDGTFTYLVSTKDGMGYAKDQWSAKPLVIMETSDIVAIASEEVALRKVMDHEIDRVEPQQGEVMTWSL